MPFYDENEKDGYERMKQFLIFLKKEYFASYNPQKYIILMVGHWFTVESALQFYHNKEN